MMICRHRENLSKGSARSRLASLETLTAMMGLNLLHRILISCAASFFFFFWKTIQDSGKKGF